MCILQGRGGGGRGDGGGGGGGENAFRLREKSLDGTGQERERVRFFAWGVARPLSKGGGKKDYKVQRGRVRYFKIYDLRRR